MYEKILFFIDALKKLRTQLDFSREDTEVRDNIAFCHSLVLYLLYQWKVMPFGLHSANVTFQRILDEIIGPDVDPYDMIRMISYFFKNVQGASVSLC